MEDKKIIRVFFSWQSDLPRDTTTNAIRETLTLAINELEDKIPDLKIIVDEATSNIPGSPDIPTTIFNKISESDILISDITTINSLSDGERKTANPNVLIELGFGLSQIGWERTILLFNEQHGHFPDEVAFDIDRKRIGKFKVIAKNDQNGKKNLKNLLFTAIKLIIEHNPKRPQELKELSTEVRKRNLDILNLKLILGKISISFLDRHIALCPDYIDTRIIYFYETFKGMIESSHFFLYDTTARKYLANILKYWTISMSSEIYRETADPHLQKFGHVPSTGVQLSKKDKSEYEEMLKAIKKLKALLQKFLDYIRHNYIEIDIDEQNRQAHKEWVEFQKD